MENLDALLDFIGKLESRNDPNAIWGGVHKADYPPVPITELTVGEVLDWQDSIDTKYMSEASGEWQFMEDTLRGLYREAGVALSEPFDGRTQKRLAVALLRRRGLDEYLDGRIAAEKFAQNLAKEWASLPAITVDRKGRSASGQSYYAGDGLNKAHTTMAAVLDQVRAVRPHPAFTTAPMRPMPRPALPPEILDLIEDTEKGGAESNTTLTSIVQALLSGAGLSLGAVMGFIKELDPIVAAALIAGGCVFGSIAVYTLRSRNRKTRKGQLARMALARLGAS